MLKKIVVVFSLMSILFMSEAMAGPFGLEKGMSLKDLGGKPKKIGPGIYRLSSVPKPHSAFAIYIVRIAPKVGLFWMKAIGKDISTSSYGSELKREFSAMKKKLESAYGKCQSIDFLRHKSIWKEPNYWMMGLKKNERFLGAIWEKKEGSSLPPDIEQIGLVTDVLSLDKGFFAIEYSFTNDADGRAELAAQEDDAL